MKSAFYGQEIDMANNQPPREITLVYREVGKTHVFSTQEFRGFHVGSSSLKFAFEKAIVALGLHVSEEFSCPVEYVMESTFSEFEDHLSGKGVTPGFIVAKIAQKNQLASC